MSPNVSPSPSTLKHKREIENIPKESPPPPPPSWEILSLLSHYMDPKTLSVASCVDTTWSNCFSCEHLWKSQLIKHHSSLFNLSMTLNTSGPSIKMVSIDSEPALTTNPELSYKRLFSIFTRADVKRHRKNQIKPKISLSYLIFIVHVSTGAKTAMVVKHGKDLTFGENERFQIEVDFRADPSIKMASDPALDFICKDMKEVKLKWQVVYKNWEKVLTMADIERSLDTRFGWFTDEFPVPENCISGSSGIVGDVKPCFNGDNVLEKISFAMVNSSDYGSLMVEDTLRYLQCFFL